MSAEGKGFVVGCVILILLIVVGTVDRIDRPTRPERPQHPSSIYYPPGWDPHPAPGDPGWRKS